MVVSRGRLTAGSASASRLRPTGNNYSRPTGSGSIRHEASFNSPVVGNPSMLALDEYFVVENFKFMRSNSSVDPDVAIDPTISNNIANPNVFNGSYISEFNNNIRLKNQDSVDTVTLDVYDIQLSFYDALVWGTILPAGCPFNFDSSTASVNAGQVSAKPVLVDDYSVQDHNNFKFMQHYSKHLGSVTIGDVQGDNVVELKQTRIPPKVKRSQTGMYWATVFVYDNTKNTQMNADIEFNQEISFKESPASNRIVNFPE